MEAQLKSRGARGTVVPGALAIILIFMISIASISFLAVQLSRYSESVKLANVAASERNREVLQVFAGGVQGNTVTSLDVVNAGPVSSIVIAYATAQPGGGIDFTRLDPPVALQPGQSARVDVRPTPIGTQIGVLTSYGNLFWISAQTPPQTPPQPPGSTVYVTFAVEGLGSDAQTATVLRVDGVSYTASQLPKTFAWRVGETHTFEWLTPILVPGARYDWASTRGLTTLRAGTINATSDGYVIATYQRTLAWLEGWQYRVSHVIYGTTVDVTDYQVKIRVHRTTGTSSGENLYVGTKCRSDFGDIRFTASDGVTQLSYWMETRTTTYADFWVKIPSIPAGGSTTIFVYYGNPTATTTSNGFNTMFIFEDFQSQLSGSLAGSAVFEQANRRVMLTPNAPNQLGYLYYDRVPTRPTGFHARFYFMAGGGSGADAVWLGAYDTSYSGTREDIVAGGYHFTYDEYQDRVAFTKSTTDNGPPIAMITATDIDNGQWHLAEIYFWYDGSRVNVKLVYDGTMISSFDSSVQSNVINGVGQMIIGGRTGGLTNYHYIGNGPFFVRKYFEPEPSHGPWGPEETR